MKRRILPDLDCAVWAYDVEVYPNYFLAGFLDVNTEEVHQFEISERRNDRDALIAWFTKLPVVIGFNCYSYDDHILRLALDGADNRAMFDASVKIIENSQRRAVYRSLFPTHDGPIVIDLRGILKQDPRSENLSLKEIGVLLGHATTQELPFDPLLPLPTDKMEIMARYNINDLKITALCTANLAGAIEARFSLLSHYGANVLSMPDAKVGEEVLNTLGVRSRPYLTKWRKKIAVMFHQNISFTDPGLAALHQRMGQKQLNYSLKTEETVDEDGVIDVQKSIEGDTYVDHVIFAGIACGIGMGGLHSDDEPGIFEADEKFALYDIDAASFYPTLIDSMNLCPTHLNKAAFKKIYRELIDTRLEAKRAAAVADDPIARQSLEALSDGLKVALNSIFGKSKSAWSWLLDPTMAATICINGQFILLDLIETVSAIPEVVVISANTDGILVKAPRNSPDLTAAVEDVAKRFNLLFETKEYTKYIRRDVNNYIAVSPNDKVKSRGIYAYAEDGRRNLGKKETKRIVTKAVLAHFLHNTPVAETIKACRDIGEFIEYFKVSRTWTAEDDAGNPLPKINRWYESTNGQSLWKRKEGGAREKLAGNLDSVVIVNDLPINFPDDINYTHYIRLAEAKIDPIVHPDAGRAHLLTRAELDEDQHAILRHAQAATTINLNAVMWTDWRAAKRDYISNYNGRRTQHDSMKGALFSLWVASRGRLTHLDLMHIGIKIDDGVGYWKSKAKRKKLEGLCRWFVNTVVPFPRYEIMTPHSSIFDSPIIPSAWLNEYLASHSNADAPTTQKGMTALLRKIVRRSYKLNAPFDSLTTADIAIELLSATNRPPILSDEQLATAVCAALE